MKLGYLLLIFFTFACLASGPVAAQSLIEPASLSTSLLANAVADSENGVSLSSSENYGGARATTLAPNTSLNVAVPAQAQEVHLALRLPATAEANSPFLELGGLEIGFVSEDADFGRVVLLEFNGDTVYTDVFYNLSEGGYPERWLRLAISLRPAALGGADCRVFIEGTQVFSTNLAAKPNLFTLSSGGAGAMQIGDLDFSDEPSDFVSRAQPLSSTTVSVASLGTAETRIITEDAVDLRAQQAGYPAIHETIRPGELNLYEEAWYMTGTVDREYWLGTQALSSLSEMENHVETFEPTGADFIPGLTTRGWNEPWAYTNHADQYLERLRAYYVPEVSGRYHFWLSADESAALYISDPEEEGAGKRLLVALEEASDYRTFDDRRRQRSKAIRLEADRPYLLEVLHYEDGGLDHLDVAVSLPDTVRTEPSQLLPASRLSSYSGGQPGTFPRTFFPRAPELLPDSVPPQEASAFLEVNEGDTLLSAAPMLMAVASSSSSGGPLLGGEIIYESDFTNTANGWIHHPQLGWLWSAAGQFPSIYCQDWDQWLWYSGGADPQQFYNFATEEWFKVFDLPTSWLVYNPVITTQPQSLSISAGETATFSIQLSHPQDPHYVSWDQDGIQVQAGGSLNLTLSAVDTNNAGQYKAYVSNAAGSVYSNLATLSVQRLPHEITISGLSELPRYGQTTYLASGVYGALVWTVPTGLSVVTQTGNSITVVGQSSSGSVVLSVSDSGDTTYLPASAQIEVTLYDDLEDSDGDGLGNLYEHNAGLSLKLKDTDGDGLEDGWEVSEGYSALSNEGLTGAFGDLDSDQLANRTESNIGSSALTPDNAASIATTNTLTGGTIAITLIGRGSFKITEGTQSTTLAE